MMMMMVEKDVFFQLDARPMKSRIHAKNVMLIVLSYLALRLVYRRGWVEMALQMMYH